MKRTIWVVAFVLLTFSVGLAHAAIPLIINHQGLVKVDGVDFDGNGSFKFGLYDGFGIWLWTNDGTHIGESIALSTPDASVTLPVTNGVYNIGLGDESLLNMTSLSSSLFETVEVRLRIFFDDGVNGEQLLAPDQQITSGAYAFHALTADFALDAGTVDGVEAASLDESAEIAAHVSMPFAHHTKTTDASELTAGTLPAARLGADVSLLGQSIDLASEVTGLLPGTGIATGAVTTGHFAPDAVAPLAIQADNADTVGGLAIDDLKALVVPLTKFRMGANFATDSQSGWVILPGSDITSFQVSQGAILRVTFTGGMGGLNFSGEAAVSIGGNRVSIPFSEVTIVHWLGQSPASVDVRIEFVVNAGQIQFRPWTLVAEEILGYEP